MSNKNTVVDEVNNNYETKYIINTKDNKILFIKIFEEINENDIKNGVIILNESSIKKLSNNSIFLNNETDELVNNISKISIEVHRTNGHLSIGALFIFLDFKMEDKTLTLTIHDLMIEHVLYIKKLLSEYKSEYTYPGLVFNPL